MESSGMESNGRIELSRDCEVVEIPGGRMVQLTKGTTVTITQALGGSYTLLVPSLGGLFRLAGRDADAIGKEVETPSSPSGDTAGPDQGLGGDALREEVWSQLKTCFDPEIPVNIVDLGLIYDLQVNPDSEGGSRVEVKMTLTAQGCGMGDSIAADAQSKIQRIPGVASADVRVVWEPPWTPDRISPEGKTVLGIA
jgi:probable FeS assembly SUF system protein SufT